MVHKTVSSSRVIMTELVLPTHTNSLGSIFGGQVMSWIDIAAAICAQRHCNHEVVTASIDELSFVAPVYKGWVVNLKASVNFVAKTSMEVGVRVDAENPKTGETFHTSSAYLTFVCLGDDGKPALVPQLTLQTDEEKRRHQAALSRRQARMARRQASKP
jgi:acyl-CoA hydrolase